MKLDRTLEGKGKRKPKVPDSYGPDKAWVMVGDETAAGEEYSPDDVNEGWPSETNPRLTLDVDWKEIIKKGEPWTDENFPPDGKSLFINGKIHRNAYIDYRKGKWSDYTWTRLSEFF